MAQSKGISGKGTRLGYSTAADYGTINWLAELKNVKRSDKSSKDIEVTSLDSDTDSEGRVYEETIGGVVTEGNVTADMVYRKDMAELVEAHFNIDRYWQITYPDGSRSRFRGRLNKNGIEANIGDAISQNIGVKISGKAVFTKAADTYKMAAFTQALTAGAATLDLTNLPDPRGAVNGNGLKVSTATFTNLATSGNAVTLTVGEINGYEMAGAGMEIELQPGQSWTFTGNDDTPVIGAGAKTLALAGTGTDSVAVLIEMA